MERGLWLLLFFRITETGLGGDVCVCVCAFRGVNKTVKNLSLSRERER